MKIDKYSSKMNKNAEITTQQIVILVVLLASFVVLLLFLLNLNFKDLSEKQICQSSVQLMGKKSIFNNLDCKTSYVCISGGGECKDFTSSETIKIISKKDEDIKNEIMGILANEMADCWWMFGEGKVDYIEWKFIGSRGCAVCAEIAFDDKLSKYEGLKLISYDELYEFLKTNYTNKDKTQTYFDYLNLVGLDNPSISKIYSGKSISFDRKYGVYTGRDQIGVLISPFVSSSNKDVKQAIPPIILDRMESSLIECKAFVTTP